MFPPFVIAAALSGWTKGAVNLDGHIISAQLEESARIRFNIDGFVEEAEDGVPTWNQIDATNDWIRPAGLSTRLYSVRYTNASGDIPFDVQASAEDAWINLSAIRQYILFSPGAGPGADQIVCTFEIRNDVTGTTENSGVYTFNTATAG